MCCTNQADSKMGIGLSREIAKSLGNGYVVTHAVNSRKVEWCPESVGKESECEKLTVEVDMKLSPL